LSDVPQTAPLLPYTYFRAEGLALDRIETAAAAKKEFDKLRKDLCKRYGASEVLCSNLGGAQPLSISTFHFTPAQEKNVPAHWEAQRQTASDGTLQTIFASPPAGSPDDFFLTDYAGLMTRAVRRMRLENLLGCGDMPMKELPAGTYFGAFVRDRNVDTGSAGEKQIGHIRDNVTFCFGSNSACRSSDPLDTMQMMGSWYIRVPNDEKGQPRVTPPDSSAVPIAEMIKLDNEERAARFNRLQSSSFDPQI
jgi:hypothetical protein